MGGAIVVFAIARLGLPGPDPAPARRPEQGPHGDPRRQLGGPRRPLAAGPARAVARPRGDPDRGPGRHRHGQRDATTSRSSSAAPSTLAPGLAWLGPSSTRPLDPAVDEPALHPPRRASTPGILDLPLIRGGQRIGHLRLAFHPPVEPDISDAALADIAGEIAGAAQLGITVADLHRREREREALYAVALQLTGRGRPPRRPRHDHPARARAPGRRAGRRLPLATRATAAARTAAGRERLAMADDGTVCRVAHEKAAANHPQNPLCPLGHATASAQLGRAPAARPGRRARRAVRRPRRPPVQPAENGACSARSPTWPRSPSARPASTRPRSSGRSTPSATGSPASSTTASPRSWASSTSSSASLETRAKDEASHGDGRRARPTSPRPPTRPTATSARRSWASARRSARTTGSRARCASTCASTAARPASRRRSRARATPRRALSPRSEVQLLRVVQEALTNTRKHAGRDAGRRADRLPRTAARRSRSRTMA